MRPAVAVLLSFALAAPLAAGCGGGDSCEEAVGNAGKIMGIGGAGYGSQRAAAIRMCQDEKWSPALRRCVIAARDQASLDRCEPLARKPDPAGAVDEYRKKSTGAEAELNLDRLGKVARSVYIETAAFPKGTVAFTPAAPCCDGPGHKCPVSAADWSASTVWSELDFDVQDPGYFQYAYESDGATARATARGDLDCDGQFVEYVLQCTAAGGDPGCTVARLGRLD